MSTTQIIEIAERLPLLERLEVIDALYASIKRELIQKTSAFQQAKKILLSLLLSTWVRKYMSIGMKSTLNEAYSDYTTDHRKTLDLNASRLGC